MRTSSSTRLAILFSSLLLILSGCGGGGGGGGGTTTGPQPQLLSGLAAAGAPIVGSVTIKDSSTPVSLEKTVTIAADGKYSVDVVGMTGPFALRADGKVGGRDYSLYSAATEADLNGTINITPFTDLIVANIAGDLAANYYASGAFSTLNATEISAAESALQLKLQPILTAVGLADSIDLLRSSFSADHTGLDGVLDIVRVTIDPVTKIAEIRNLISNTAITDNLSSKTDAGAFTTQDAANVAAGMTDMQLIVVGFDRFSALFATSLPGPTNPELLALFDQANFLDDGTGLEVLLSELTTDPTMIGMQFANVTAIALDPVAGSGVVEFTPIQSGQTQKMEIIRFKMAKSNGVWLMQGNQRIAHASLSANARLFTGNTIAQFETGLDPEIRDQGGRGIDYAVINGPGLLPDSVILRNVIGFDHFTDSLNPGNDFLAMDEATVAALPDTGAVYTITLWEDNNTAPSADDTLLATYTETLLKRPYKPSELTPAAFPALTPQSQSTWQAFSGGALTVSWTLPAGLQADFLFVNMSGVEGSAQAEASLAAAATTATLTINPVTATGVPITVTNRNLDLGAIDGFGRRLSTIYSF
jgi:hypothetical protein